MGFLRALGLIVLAVLLLHITEAYQVPEPSSEAPSISPLPQVLDCGEACIGRCNKSSRPRLCKRACGSCCYRCKCVPSGTYGNYEQCPCYFNLTTHNNTRKCP